jgi:class 3 adenylate cyclase
MSIADVCANLRRHAVEITDRTITELKHDVRNHVNQIAGYAEIASESAAGAALTAIDSKCKAIAATARAAIDILNAFAAPQPESTDFERLGQEFLRIGNRMELEIAGCLELAGTVGAIELQADLRNVQLAIQAYFLRVTTLQGAGSGIEAGSGPVSATGFATEPISRAQPSGESSEATILVVDDESGNRDILVRQLARAGYCLVTASNGRQSLEVLRNRAVDLVLLDMMMPEMDGFEALQRIKQDPALKQVSVIMVSAVDDVRNIAKCIESGAEDYVFKPVEFSLLRARVKATLERKRLRDLNDRRILELKEAIDAAQAQRDLSESLLLNILPQKAADELRANGSVTPMYFEDVTILFTDFVGFMASTEQLSAEELVYYLNEYVTAFDDITTRYGLEKLKTIGDSYMLVSGLPVRSPSHPVDAVLAAFDLVDLVKQKAALEEGPKWDVRVGIHTGPVIAGVVGKRKFAFDIWGDSVNLASRMESGGLCNRINISEKTYSRVKDFFQCEHRGPVEVKGGRKIDMYCVESLTPRLQEPNCAGGAPEAFRRRYRTYFQKELPAFAKCLTR